MLRLLRNQKTQKKIYIVLAIAVITTFAISGIYLGKERGNPTSSVGTIGGKNITVKDYLASYSAIEHQARMIYGASYDQVRPFINMKGEAWDRLLLLHYAKIEGLKTGDGEVVEWISSQPFLQNKSGFDNRAYKMFTQYLRMDNRLFEEEVRQTLTIQKISNQLGKKITLNDEDLRNLYTQKKGERSIQYIVLSVPAGESNDTPSEEELKKIYSMYQNLLTEPAKISIRYIFIPKENVDTLKEALADNQSTLDTLSSKFGLKVTKTPYFSRNQAIPGLGLITEIIDKSFSLDTGKISEWLSLNDGSYKIELNDKKPAKNLTFEEGREQLKEILTRQKSVEASLDKLNQLAKDLKPEGFEKFAAAQKLEIRSSENFKSGAYLAGIGPSAPIEKELGSVQEGQISKAIAVPTGAAIVKVLKNAPINEKDFTAEKESLKKELMKSKTEKEMDELLKKLRSELKPNLEILKETLPDDETTGPSDTRR